MRVQSDGPIGGGTRELVVQYAPVRFRFEQPHVGRLPRIVGYSQAVPLPPDIEPRAAPVYYRLVPDRQCPLAPEDCAERYCRNEMPEAEAKEFEQHCDACARCNAILVRELAIMGMVRAAARASGTDPKS